MRGLFTTVRVALRALLIHKGRSFLTSLGVIIGVGSVIAMVSAGDGVQQKLDESMDTVGKNLIVVRPGARSHSGVVTDATPLTRRRRRHDPQAGRALPQGVAEVQLTHAGGHPHAAEWPTLLNGTVADLQGVRNWNTTSGRFFTREEDAEAADVCVLGQTVRAKLFPDDPNPLGQTIRIDRLRLRVVGVLAAKGRNPAGADQDDEIFTPITTLQRKLVGEDHVSTILAAARSEGLLEQARQEVARAMRQSHGVKDGTEDFDVTTVRRWRRSLMSSRTRCRRWWR